MLQRFYSTFISPKQKNEDDRNREIVLNLLLSGTLLILLLVLPALSISYAVSHHYYISPVMSLVALAVVYVGLLYRLSRKGHFRAAAFMLVGLYFAIATTTVYLWGISIPSGILLFGLVIVLAGILLGPKHSLYNALAVIAVLAGLQLGADYGVVHPDMSWITQKPNLGDVFGFGLTFSLISLVTWLFNKQMARSLHKAEKAEAALKKQKALLETTVEERTRELQAAQLEKVSQMYRFAELGQLSTAMMHDLANHLTSLTVNIESLEGKSRSKVLDQAKKSIRYIDEMVVRVRDQLQGRTKVRNFNASNEIEEVVTMLRHRGQLANVTLKSEMRGEKNKLLCRGDTVKFRQMMANLICNAIDAYEEPAEKGKENKVLVTVTAEGLNIIITVNDWGKGIPAEERPFLFEPFHSTKKMGMGMGLFIVRQIVEEHFLGSVYVDTTKPRTAFVVELPRASS